MAKKSPAQKAREKQKRISESEPVSSRSGRRLAGVEDLHEMLGVGKMMMGLFVGIVGAVNTIAEEAKKKAQPEPPKQIDQTEDGEAIVISSQIKK